MAGAQQFLPLIMQGASIGAQLLGDNREAQILQQLAPAALIGMMALLQQQGQIPAPQERQAPSRERDEQQPKGERRLAPREPRTLEELVRELAPPSMLAPPGFFSEGFPPPPGPLAPNISPEEFLRMLIPLHGGR